MGLSTLLFPIEWKCRFLNVFFFLSSFYDRQEQNFFHSLKDFYDVYREQGRVYPNTHPIFCCCLSWGGLVETSPVIYLYIFSSDCWGIGWHFVNKGCVQRYFYNPLFFFWVNVFSFYLYGIEGNHKNISGSKERNLNCLMRLKLFRYFPELMNIRGRGNENLFRLVLRALLESKFTSWTETEQTTTRVGVVLMSQLRHWWTSF